MNHKPALIFKFIEWAKLLKASKQRFKGAGQGVIGISRGRGFQAGRGNPQLQGPKAGPCPACSRNTSRPQGLVWREPRRRRRR